MWDVLEEVITEHPVLLNRAPTLHRLGIQAFEPKLIEGKAIQIHPLVCTAFNADFDGDQMAVHVPLSAEAQAEARILMLSSNNILSPASGLPITLPTQDMVLGIYHLTRNVAGAKGEGRAFASVAEAIMAFDRHELSLHATITIRVNNVTPGSDLPAPDGFKFGDELTIKSTTLGRVLFNDAMPADFEFVNALVDKKKLGQIVNRLAAEYTKVEVASTLDQLKELGFHWATRSGISIGIEDVIVPPTKKAIIEKADIEAAAIDDEFQFGGGTESERREKLAKLWTAVRDELAKEMEKQFAQHESNPVWQMFISGARGSSHQIAQLAAIRGLMHNARNEIIPQPIKASFREGLSMLDYFISAYGARKGLADTALRTADAGYLTRRLVDVSQDVIVREEDCGTDRGFGKVIAAAAPRVIGKREARFAFNENPELARDEKGSLLLDQNAAAAVSLRYLSEDVVSESGEVLAKTGELIRVEMLPGFIAAGVSQIKVRSVLTCESKLSVCGKCYGYSLANNRPVEIGEAVGIIAAQSIGEPGTQLTMRTFHTGGAVGESGQGDITAGLPRVQELFEAREPKVKAEMARAAGTVRIEEAEREVRIFIDPDDGSKYDAHTGVPRRALLVADGDHVIPGQLLTKGNANPKEVLEVINAQYVQRFLVNEVQEVYRSQGQAIHDKHIEIIVRQMLRRIIILESGDSGFLDGDLVDRFEFNERTREMLKEGKQPASGRFELMGITKASLATESWLSAASFQETTKVLTDAALAVKSDRLLGLKENVILGKLIPAGTGLTQYRSVVVEPTEEAKAAVAASLASYADEFGDYGFGSGSGEAVRLDDLRLNDDYYGRDYR